jgi:hypothetical protein
VIYGRAYMVRSGTLAGIGSAAHRGRSHYAAPI